MTVKSSDPPAGQDPSHSHDPPPSYQASTTDASSSTTDPSSPLPPSNIYPNIQPYPALAPAGPRAGPMHHSPSFGASNVHGPGSGGRGYSESSHLHPCPHPAVHYQHQQQQQIYRPHPHPHHITNANHHGHGSPEEWTPPATDAIARARARRRFFVAFCWGLLVYLVLGSIIGTSQVDIHNSHNRKYHPHPYYLQPSGSGSDSQLVSGQSSHLTSTAGDFLLREGDFPSDDTDVDMIADGYGLMATTPLPADVEFVGDGDVVEAQKAEADEGQEGGWLPSF